MIQNMEQTSYWMWARRKFNTSTHLQSSNSYNDSSWEEQAFAEDSSGPLGGCIWPPRSYSCSFCRREFRSAQALGGHMNVHRRDRARLRQSPTTTSPITSHMNNVHHNPCTTVLNQYPSEVHTLVYPNPNFPSPLSSSRVASNQEINFIDKALVSTQLLPPTRSTISCSYSSSLEQEHGKSSSLCSPLPLLSDSIAFQVLSIKRDGFKTQERDCLGKVDSSKPESDLVCLKRKMDCGTDEEATISCKRLRNNATLPFFNRPSAPMEDLDLELRLGDRPKTVTRFISNDSVMERASSKNRR